MQRRQEQGKWSYSVLPRSLSIVNLQTS